MTRAPAVSTKLAARRTPSSSSVPNLFWGAPPARQNAVISSVRSNGVANLTTAQSKMAVRVAVIDSAKML